MSLKPLVIGVLISSPSISENVKKLAESKDVVIRISYQSLEAAVPFGKKMEEEGVEVIIGRRGTACLLRESLQIPVLSFPQSSLDVIRSLKEAAKKGRRIFMPSVRENRPIAEVIGEFLDIEFGQGVYSNSATLRQIIAQAARDGFEVAIGGASTMRYATEFGLKYCELITSEEEFSEAVENAKSVALAQREQKAAAQRYQSIIDATSDGLIAADPFGRVITVNRSARRMLDLADRNLHGTTVSRLIPSGPLTRVLQTKKPLHDSIERVGDEMLVFNHVPVLLGDELIGVVSSFKEISHVMKSENRVRRTLARGFVARYTLEDLIHRDPKMMNVVELSREFAKTDSCILITGETGTGKEIIAQSIHNLSRRKDRPFVSVHCSALTEHLLENELFGHEEGAFTGAKKGGKPGFFELSHQGTIFLDEIDSTSFSVQLRLLRILQEKEVIRIGGEHKIPIDVRVIAAAGQDLWAAVREGTFRKDLFFRLNVLRISIPPLRERPEDIPRLLDHFIRHYATVYRLEPPSLPKAYVLKLKAYSWPGNVRQLRHFIEQLLLNRGFQPFAATLDHLYQELLHIAESPEQRPPSLGMTQRGGRGSSLEPVAGEKERIRAALEECRFNKTKAAGVLGIGRTTLWRKMKELDLR